MGLGYHAEQWEGERKGCYGVTLSIAAATATATAKYYAKRVQMENAPRNVLHTLQQHFKNSLNNNKQTMSRATNKLQTINN